MKTCTCAVSILLAFGTIRCDGGTFPGSFVSNIRFVDAFPVIRSESEPLRLSVDTGDRVVLLDLGAYSTNDVGKTFSFVRDATNQSEWEAIAIAMRGDSITGTGETTMWFGLEEAPIDYRDLTEGFPNYNLHQIDITPRYIRLGFDDDNTFRTADFNAGFYWREVPEPSTTTFLLSFTLSRVLCNQRNVQKRRGIVG